MYEPEPRPSRNVQVYAAADPDLDVACERANRWIREHPTARVRRVTTTVGSIPPVYVITVEYEWPPYRDWRAEVGDRP